MGIPFNSFTDGASNSDESELEDVEMLDKSWECQSKVPEEDPDVVSNFSFKPLSSLTWMEDRLLALSSWLALPDSGIPTTAVVIRYSLGFNDERGVDDGDVVSSPKATESLLNVIPPLISKPSLTTSACSPSIGGIFAISINSSIRTSSKLLTSFGGKDSADEIFEGIVGADGALGEEWESERASDASKEDFVSTSRTDCDAFQTFTSSFQDTRSVLR